MKTKEEIDKSLERFFRAEIKHNIQYEAFEKRMLREIKDKTLREYFLKEFIDFPKRLKKITESNNKNVIENEKQKLKENKRRKIEERRKRKEKLKNKEQLDKINGKFKKNSISESFEKLKQKAFRSQNAITTSTSIWTVKKK